MGVLDTTSVDVSLHATNIQFLLQAFRTKRELTREEENQGINNREFTLADVNNGLRKRKLTCVKLCQIYIDRIKEVDRELNVVSVFNPEWKTLAQECDMNYDADHPITSQLSLYGIPILVDGYAYGREFNDVFEKSTASAIAMLKAQGAIILGRTATAERTVNGAYAKDQHPGFESPGSCVAAGLGLAAACLGSKQKSIKNYYTTMGAPCVRIKPTVGLISAQGMINIERSGNDEQLSPVPIARSVEDAALLLSVLSGRHDYVPRQLDFTGTQVVIAVPKNRERNRDNTAEKQFRNMFATICAKLKDSGANIVEADDLLFPHGASMAHSPQLVEIQTANQDPMSAAGEGPSSNKSANTALDTQIEATLKRWQCDAILVPEGSFHGFFLSEPCDLSQTPVIHLPLGFYSNPETPTDKGDTRSDGYPRKVISAHHVPFGAMLLGRCLSEKKLCHIAAVYEAELRKSWSCYVGGKSTGTTAESLGIKPVDDSTVYIEDEDEDEDRLEGTIGGNVIEAWLNGSGL